MELEKIDREMKRKSAQEVPPLPLFAHVGWARLTL